jgi:hypothetical protein
MNFQKKLIQFRRDDGLTTDAFAFSSNSEFAYIMKTTPLIIGIAAAFVCALSTTQASDSFAGAPLVANNSTVSGSNATATTEPGERLDANPIYSATKTMWYRYVAPARGIVRITTPTSPDLGFNHHIQVFRGNSLTALNLINYQEASALALTAGINLQFAAEAGMEFRIVFAARGTGAGGDFNFTVQQEAWPYGSTTTPLVAPDLPVTAQIPNDIIAQAKVIPSTSSPVSVLGYNYDATTDSLGPEPSISGNRTLWYSWTASQRGIAVITTPASPLIDFGHKVAVFRGAEMTTLNVVSNAEVSGALKRAVTLSFPVEAGMEYKIAFGGRSSSASDSGQFFFSIRTDAWPYGVFPTVAPGLPVSSVPLNDQFDGASVIPSALGKYTVFGYNQSATTASSAFEPSKIGFKSLWYKWTAPENATVILQTPSAPSVGFAHSLITHTGPSYDGLSPLAGGSIVVSSTTTGGITQFSATQGTTYYFSFTAARDSSVGSIAFSFEAFRDQVKPLVTITSKKPKPTSAKSILITGTASDLGGIARVQYFVGKGPKKTATGTTTWQLKAKLKKGKNTITIFATDLTGNVSVSKVIKVKRK